jgi:hypothetical protein
VSLPATNPRERERRLLALRFLGHFVGDLHQPLHVGFSEDLGGNLITVKWDAGLKHKPEDATLHSVWDGKILARAGITDQVKDGLALNKQITQAELDTWQNFDITTWAAESLTYAVSAAYVQPNGSPVFAGTLLSDDYFKAGRPIVVEQLKKAGVGLAYLINAVAAGTLPDNLLQLTP